MARTKQDKPESGKTRCFGGKSLWCQHFEHDRAAIWWNCGRCGLYMGCRLCAQIPREIICSSCHDWATTEALNAHGPMVRRNKTTANEVREMLKKADPAPTGAGAWEGVPF